MLNIIVIKNKVVDIAVFNNDIRIILCIELSLVCKADKSKATDRRNPADDG